MQINSVKEAENDHQSAIIIWKTERVGENKKMKSNITL